jgi:hypothetical protein
MLRGQISGSRLVDALTVHLQRRMVSSRLE